MMSGSVLFETGDDLTETNIQRAFARVGNSDYVNSGLLFTADYQAAVLDITAGIAYILDDGRDYTVFPDGEAGLPLATDGVNHVFLTYDPSIDPPEERVDYEINTTNTPPAVASLKVGEVDMGAQTTTEVNRTPPVNDEDATTLKGNEIDSDGDGVVDAADTAAVSDRTTALGPAGDTVAKSDVLLRDGSTALTGEWSLGTGNIVDIGTTTWANADGTRMMRATVRDSEDLYRFVPVADGSARTGSALRYEFGPDRWVTGGGTHRVTGAAGTIDISTATANRARLLPVLGGTGLFNEEFYFDFGDLQWKFQPTVLFGTETANQLSIRTGNGLARLTPETPNGAEFDNEFYFDFNDRKWKSDTDVEVQGQPVIREGETAAAAHTSDGLTRTGRASFVTRAPNGGFETTTIPPGDYARKTIYTPADDFLYIWVWGIIDDDGTSPSGLDLVAYYLGGGEIERTGSARALGGGIDTPIFKTDQNIELRMENGTGSEVDASADVGRTFEVD